MPACQHVGAVLLDDVHTAHGALHVTVFGAQVQPLRVVVPGTYDEAVHGVVAAASDALAAGQFDRLVLAPVIGTLDVEVLERTDRQADVDVLRLVAVVLARDRAVGDGHVVVQVAEALARIEGVADEHDAQVAAVIHEVVLVGVAAGHAVDDVREVHGLERCGRDVVVLIAQRGVELSDAHLELGNDLPGGKGIHHLQVLLPVAVGRA